MNSSPLALIDHQSNSEIPQPVSQHPNSSIRSSKSVLGLLPYLILLLTIGAGYTLCTNAAEGVISLAKEGTNTYVQIHGGNNSDWHLFSSSNLTQWTKVPAFGTLISGDINPPVRLLNNTDGEMQFYRAVKTKGLYDDELVRTVSLTFTQANWRTQLTNARMRGTNIVGTLSLDNGITNLTVGARYKGNTSFSASGTKKSLNIELDHVDPSGDLMSYETMNLNNAFGDETVMREPLYFNVMQQYTVSPKGALAKLYINGEYWGLYSLAQQEDGDMIRDWFPSNDGDRWRAPNAGSGSALNYRGTNVASYRPLYELKTDNSTNAWENLMRVITVLNNTPTNQFRDKIEDVLNVDRWLWFLAIENIFADDDSYFNKGADYILYYEPESGQIHPVEHDGNEAFTAGDTQLSPVQGATSQDRPVLFQLLRVPEFRQRYLAHMRTVLEETYNPSYMTAQAERLRLQSLEAITADTKKGYTMAAYSNDFTALKSFVTNRYRFLTNHAELRPTPPVITTVRGPEAPTAREMPVITAQVPPGGTNGIDSVWLYHRTKSYGRFAKSQMFDDGTHSDGTAGDLVYGASITNYPAGTKVHYYVEARSGNSVKAASFSPARAEHVTYSYQVGVPLAENTPVVINELMASNESTIADPQGDFDDWIELRNITNQEVDISGYYLTDEADNPRKWQIPAGTTIPANGYLLIWADENGTDTPGLHASFKLAALGEELFLIDRDANFNAILDSVAFGLQEADRSYGREAIEPETWKIVSPSPRRVNP